MCDQMENWNSDNSNATRRLECQDGADSSIHYDLPLSRKDLPSYPQTEDPSVAGGTCVSYEISQSSHTLPQSLSAAGQYSGVYGQAADVSFTVSVETHFKTSKKPKKYMLPKQEDPNLEKERQDAVRSFHNRCKKQKQEIDLISTLEVTTEEVNRLRPQRDVLKQRVEEMERMLNPHHYLSDGSSVPHSRMSASGIQYPCAANQNQPRNSRQIIRTENLRPYGDSLYNQHNPATPTSYSNALGVAPHSLGDSQNSVGGSQNSFLQPFPPASQETRTANSGTYGATSYDNQSEKMPAYVANAGIPPYLSGTSASNQPNIASSSDGSSVPHSRMSASGIQYPCAANQNQPRNSRQIIRTENLGPYGDSLYNQHNPATPTSYSNALGVAPHSLGDSQNSVGGSQNSFLQPFPPASQETRTANSGTYGATSYDNQSEKMPVYVANAGIPPYLSGTSASNQPNIASSSEFLSEGKEFHPFMEHQTRYPDNQ